MCGRFVSARKRLELLEEFAATRDATASGDAAGSDAAASGKDGDAGGEKASGYEKAPDYNVAPTKRIYTVLEHKEERELRLVRWGLVPSWAKDTKVGSRMINARSETVAEKPSFRAAFARRRCLIPADGYYEWMTEDKVKQPYYIRRTDNGVLAFAGLYELWRNKEVPEDAGDAWYWSATIITTQATDEVGRIHDRTPMTIDPADWADWLDPANKDKEPLLAVMRPATDGTDGSALVSYRVSTEVNAVRNNGAALIEPLAT